MFLFESCKNSGHILCGSFEEGAILSGVSDVIAVKHKDGTFKSSPFLASFGPYLSTHHHYQVEVIVNQKLIMGVTFQLDHKGYISPRHLSNKQINKMELRFGMNTITYRLEGITLNAEIYLYSDIDKLVVSDVDGTATKNDIGGHLHNMLNKDFLHPGYADLMEKIDLHGYKVVWLTMRSLPLYQYSKKYLKQMCRINAPIMAEPQEFTNSLYHEVTKQTGNIKANMVLVLRSLFDINPFAGGLGNRDNDAIAYRYGGIPMDKIYFVDSKSRVHHMHNHDAYISYQSMVANIQEYFPYYFSPKTNYKSIPL